jgi:pimeloyl-ACP methyl ester carboxylesterase
LTLAFDRLGSGPPLVLLHGVGHRRQAWGPVLDRLTPHREVILVDLPGHGQSPPLDRGQPIVDALLAPVLCLLSELGLERPHLAGNSVGGRLALEAAVAGRAATVTALSPAGFWATERDRQRAVALLHGLVIAGTWSRPLAPALARSTAGRAMAYGAVVARPSRLSPRQARDDMAAFVQARPAVEVILPALPAFAGRVPAHVPVTIAWGTRDRILPQRQILTAKAQLPKARMVPLPGCGHVPMSDDPSLVADILLRGSGALPG